MLNPVSKESVDLTQQNIEKLKELFPEILTDGNKVDFDMLQTILGEEIDGEKERYSFTWPGKRDAIIGAQQPSKGTLRPNVEKSKDFDTTENLYIEGDNLEVLKLLQKSYNNKIKVIYIDPPYNTGKDFVYKDNFRDGIENYLEQTGQVDSEGNLLSANSESNGRFHSEWLNMMYSRLKLARNVLTEDGAIFISIDNNEVANLKKICDEIFGEKNFISLVSVENNPKGRKNSAHISVSSEHLLIYARDIKKSYFKEVIPKNATDMTLDENGRYVHNSGKRVLVGENSFNNYVTNINSEKNYSVYYNHENKKIKLKTEAINEIETKLVRRGYKQYTSIYNGKLVENTYTKEKFLELAEAQALQFSEDKIYEKNFNDTIRMKSQLVNKKYEAIVNGRKEIFSLGLTTTEAGTYIKELFNTNSLYFDAPKNVRFIKILLKLIDGDDFYVLDFFSGSATTADATIQLNSEDNGRRKYIMVQIPEKLEKDSPAFHEGYRYITDIAVDRIKRTGEKQIKNQPLFESNLDIGFKYLELDKSNIKEWNTDFDNLEDEIDLFAEVFVEGRNELDVIYEIMLKNGLDLTLPVDFFEVDGKKIYDIAFGLQFVCLADEIDTSIAKAIISKRGEYGMEIISGVVFKDAGFNGNDSEKLNCIQLLKDAGFIEENLQTI